MYSMQNLHNKYLTYFSYNIKTLWRDGLLIGPTLQIVYSLLRTIGNK